jgi:hypothetical protein
VPTVLQAWARPPLGRVPADVGALTTHGWDIRAVADPIEPLEHQGQIVAPDPDGLNRQLDVLPVRPVTRGWISTISRPAGPSEAMSIRLPRNGSRRSSIRAAKPATSMTANQILALIVAKPPDQ